MPTDGKFDEKVAALAAADARYAAEAYSFVREAVTHTAKQHKPPPGASRRHHITGRQLLEGFRGLMLERFGCLALEVLADWGVRRTEDVGDIVFSLVRHGLLGASEEDSPADFSGVYDFEEAFGAPFRPSHAPPRRRADLPRIA